MGGRKSCKFCDAAVAKSAQALKCSRCEAWVHTGCGGLVSGDYDFMVKREKSGFRWFCSDCLACGPTKAMPLNEDNLAEKVASAVAKQMSKLEEELSGRLSVLEAAAGSTMTPPQFSEIVKKTLDDQNVRKKKEDTILVSSQGRTTTVRSQEVLLIQPKAGVTVDQSKTDAVAADIQSALKSIPVNSCRKTRKGGLVVKFPTRAQKEMACAAIGQNMASDSHFALTEPAKLLPKMTVTGISATHPDEDIISGIIDKSEAIKDMMDKGSSMELCFAKSQGEYKYAVIKMSPDIRAAILRQECHVFVGLNRCRAYDRFWVTQCFHCQQFGHMASGCPKKDEQPTCSFCAGRHESRSCTDKSSPCCSNCSSVGGGGGGSHFASSKDCPIMASQRQKLIERTNLSV